MKKFVLTISILGILYSCTDEFADPIANPKQLTILDFYQNEEDALLAINACYDPFMTVWGLYMQFIYYGYSGYTIHERKELENMTFSSNMDMSNAIYIYLYRGIYRCNLVFENVPQIEFDDPALKKQYLAQAYFMRGMYNFYLGLLYGTPPILNETLTTNFKGWCNSDPGEIFKQAISDFKEAETSLPLFYDDDNIGRATKGAAQAMLGKCYLWLEDWENSRLWFDKVIKSDMYSLVTPNGTDSVDYFSAYMSNFTEKPFNGYGGENNSESVFEVQFSNNDDWWSSFLTGYGSSGSRLYKYFGLAAGASYQNLSAKLGAEKLFETPGPGTMKYDPRRAATFFFIGDTVEFRTDEINENFGGIYPTFEAAPKTFWDPLAIRKYYFPQWYESSGLRYPNNWRLIRYADVLLMFAEADYQLNGNITTEGLNAINQIRTRVGMPVYASGDIGPEVFKSERLREFLYEINPTFHFIRWSTQSDKWVSNMIEYNPKFQTGKHELLPFPEEEVIFQEGALVQNPGY